MERLMPVQLMNLEQSLDCTNAKGRMELTTNCVDEDVLYLLHSVTGNRPSTGKQFIMIPE